MKRYNYLQALYMSFYSRDLYRDVAKNWGASVILYLFIVLFICWASMMFKYQPLINTAFRSFINEVTPQVPPMTIKEGTITTPENKPYLIKEPDKDEVIAIIDTSGEYPNMDKVPRSTLLLITKDTTYYVDNHSTLRVNKIPNTISINIVPEKIQSVAIKFVGWLWLLMLPILLIMSFIYRLVQALFYGVIGKVFSVLSSVQLTYVQNLKLSMVAVTPAIVFATLMDWFNITFRFEWLVCFLIAMSYLVCAINSHRPNGQNDSAN